MFSSLNFPLYGRLCIFFLQQSWWPFDCAWKWYRNPISNLLFWITLGAFLLGHFFFFPTKWSKNTVEYFLSKAKIRTKTYLVRYNYFRTAFWNSKCLDCKSHDLLIWMKWQFFTGSTFYRPFLFRCHGKIDTTILSCWPLCIFLDDVWNFTQLQNI